MSRGCSREGRAAPLTQLAFLPISVVLRPCSPMGLKYAAYLPRCQPPTCDCLSKYTRRTLVVFRITHGNPATEDDFVPPAAMPETGDDHRGVPKCSNYGVSLYKTLNNARRRWKRLNERVDAASRYGSFVGKLEVIPSDGLLSPHPSGSGHLNLFQDESARFSDRITEYQAASDETGGNDESA